MRFKLFGQIRFPWAYLLLCGLLLAACQTSPQATPAPSRPTATPVPTSAAPSTPEAAPYLNPDLPVDQRVDDLLSRMTLAEKIGQMTQVEKGSIDAAAVETYFIGSILSGGGGSPDENTPAAWRQMVAGFQNAALSTRLGIPLLYGVDAVHGHNNVKGATIFPHNVGLGAANDADLVARIGAATAQEMIATGICWDFAPVVAVPQDIRWGRAYEGYSENTERVSRLGAAFVRGLQGDPLTVLATPKHYVADGGTLWGTSAQYQIDQGDAQIDETTLRTVHLPPYQAAIEAGAQTIMVSYSSWNGVKMHAQRYLLTDVLKGELGFQGFLVSDWQAIDQIPGDYYSDVVTSINAGLDMIMVPYDYLRFIDTLTQAVNNGDVSMARIDDAVRRILTAKFKLGLFERPLCGEIGPEAVGADEHRALGREAVARSLVLLKNDAALPIPKDVPLLYVGGSAADNIGIQSGGWTIEWQGKTGDITPGTTILAGIQEVAGPAATIEYNRTGKFDDIADVGVAVVGERPYAEGRGDDNRLALSRGDRALIENMRQHSRKLVLVVLSGRPIIITDVLDAADAVVAAWLPGTEGAGVADALFGDRPFSGTLPYTWPRSADQLPFDFGNLPASGCDAPLFPFGYGLTAADSGPLDLPECGTAQSTAAESAATSDRISLVDDFETGDLPQGSDSGAQIGYLTWSDGSPVSIQTITVDPDDERALPGQDAPNTVLQLDTTIGSGNWAGFSHAFMNADGDTWTPQDWSSYQGLALWLYGNATGGTLFIDILDNRNPDSQTDDAERFSYDILDDFEGWQYFQIPFEDFRRKEIGNDAPNDGLTLTEMHGYAVGVYGSTDMGAQSNFVDNVALYGQAPERPVEVAFAKAEYSMRETGRTTVRVKLNKVAQQPVTVDYHTVAGSATPGRDFEPAAGTLTFQPGEREQSFRIPALDDHKAEGQEKALVVLSNPTGAQLGFQRRAVLTVRDNDNQDPNLLLDFETFPPFEADPGVSLSIPEIAPDSELAQPDQVDYEHVLQVDYTTSDQPASFGASFAAPQNWGDKTGVSFWFRGKGDGATITFEILDNQSADRADTSPQDWALLWSDEFDGPAGAPPNPAFWQPEIGDGTLNGIPGWGNSELETYTADPENVSMDGAGHLAITAREVNPEQGLVCWYGDCLYSSARLITWRRAEFEFGRVEARLKLPAGAGLWPAFWMLGTNLDQVGWPRSGEIDIMENIGREPNRVYATVHGPGYSGGQGIGQGYDLGEPVSADFHTYAIEWTPNLVRWFVDDTETFSVSPDDLPSGAEWVYNHPFFLLLNVAVGGNWPGNPDANTVFPQTMLVDYVRVYGAANSSERYTSTFKDDKPGWRQITLPFDAFTRGADQPVDAPDDGFQHDQVWGYGFRLPADGNGSFYLDHLRLE
jgi:beta-glucosidase